MRVDFNKLKTVIRNSNSTILANSSADCLSEFNVSLINYIEYTHGMSAEELSMFVISLELWRQRRLITRIPVSVSPGDIFYSDLGIGYSTELSYPHPVLVLEKVGNMVMVVPSTTSQDRINIAYHPVDNPTAHRKMWKVTRSDGFENTCALVLENVRTFGVGHLISKKGCLQNMALLTDIKSMLVETYFSLQHKMSEELKNENSTLQQELEKKNTETEDLKKEIESLKSQLEILIESNQVAATTSGN